ncbi:MAG: hypothetical protein Q4P13_07385 [Psychrobacter sp.]|nr:hypothetical protein [Psychrobacter sp.]
MSKVILNRTYLKAMLLFAAKHDPRPYLEGICFFGNPGKLLAFATNGHVLARWEVASNNDGHVFKHLISRQDIEFALAATKGSKQSRQLIYLNTDTGRLMDYEGDDFYVHENLDSSDYPTAQKVIDKILSDGAKPYQTPAIQPKYYKLIAKVGKLFSDVQAADDYYGGGMPRLYKADNKSGNIFTFDRIDDFMCVVMPTANHNLHYEHKAVLMSEYAGDPVRQVIKDGKWAWCSVSNTYDPHLAGCRNNLRMLIAYDDDCYMDTDCETWRYAELIDVVDSGEGGK